MALTEPVATSFGAFRSTVTPPRHDVSMQLSQFLRCGHAVRADNPGSLQQFPQVAFPRKQLRKETTSTSNPCSSKGPRSHRVRRR